MDKFTIKLVLIVFICVGFVVFLIVKQEGDCKDKGGEMVGTGKYSTTYVMSGNVLIPLTSEIFECNK